MIKFEVGKTYYARSICDYDCIYEFKILSRTEKSLKTDVRGEVVTRRIKVWNDVEIFRPFGTYSMCAVVYADKEYKP